MTTSGTYSFSPSLGDVTLYAFNLVGVRPTALTQEHMQSAYMAANLIQSEWSARGVNLWKVELVTQALTQGTSTYSVSPSVITILDAYITVGTGSAATDRYILPISRTEYSTYANKTTQGFPTVYWLDRLQNPSVTLWPVPDGNEVSISYYAVQQIEDAQLAGASQPDIQYYFTRAYAYALARELSLIWAKEAFQLLSAEAERAFGIAAEQNVENNSVFFAPTMSQYWRV
jgi:hypothetical protein